MLALLLRFLRWRADRIVMLALLGEALCYEPPSGLPEVLHISEAVKQSKLSSQTYTS